MMTEKHENCETKPGVDFALSSEMTQVFKALADETRLKILLILLTGESCVCQIANLMEMSLPAVSHHLRLLRMMRIVGTRREGRQIYYSLLDQHIVDLIQVAREHAKEEIK